VSIELIGARELSADLTRAAAAMPKAARKVTEANGEHLRDLWRDNARQTAGHHGRRYPSSITAETVPTFGDAVVEVGPDTSKPQGGMGPGFEYGSVNQEPHLDGKRAADVIEPRYQADLEALAAGIL
jgi:hypothetical protein